MHIPDKKPVYLSFLLRMWQTNDNGRQVWRASLEQPGSGERRGFASLDALFEFLRKQIQDEQDYFHQRHRE